MGSLVICCFRPKPGKADELLDVIKTHMPTLRSQGFITDRPAYVMRAKDGTIIEVFEWKSTEAIEAAHSNPVVGEMWKRYAEVCDFVPVGQVEEAMEMFSQFTPLEE